MAIYRMVNGKEWLDKVDQTSFGKEGVLEKWDLQRILRDQPEVLEDKLLVIYEEFGNWQDSNRRIDLLCLDSKGQLVVVELKRGDTGEHMDLQAIRYAAMVANMTREQVIETYQEYLEKRAKEEGRIEDEDAAETRIRERFGEVEPDSEPFRTDIPRIILASEKFGMELTTCVLWLNASWLTDIGLEIKCVRLQPHRNGDEILIEVNEVVPLPEEADYQIQLGKRQRETIERGTAKPEIVLGGGRFKESIARADEGYRLGLERLYECALHLEESSLAELSTYVNGKGNYLRLQLRPPDWNEYLVSFNNLLYEKGVGEISIVEQGWMMLGPEATKRMDELIGPTKPNSGARYRKLSKARTYENLDKILEAIREAYQELAGIPSE